MAKLTDKVAMITGSDSGIGHASAVEFAKEGADVVVNYLHDEEGANKTKDEVEAQGRRAIVVQADHGYEDQVEKLFAAAFDAFGKVDVLMNNASVDASGIQVADIEIEKFERTMRSNFIGQLLCCKHFVRHRKDSGGGGKIINVTSIHEDIPNPGGADYDCSKSALRMLTRTLSLEVAQDGINVNSLAPGMVLTPFNQKAIDDPDFREQQVQSIPMKRAAQPEEIAKLALFLASSDSDYVTGSEYVMDGGLMRNVGQGA
jgi:glucose 1-dehydrogenase